jgi:23S rRNA (adenine(2503)-C(2))-methyltransferase
VDTNKLAEVLKEKKEPAFRFKQICKAVFEDAIPSFLDISTISKKLRIELENEVNILPFKEKEVLISRNKKAIKALLELEDGNIIETVLLSPKEGTWSACISSQVGCALGCAFCATGKNGLVRDLSGDEITSQVLFWKQYLAKNKLPGQFSNIVYMGMGEPFLNWKNVKESLKVLIDEQFFNFGSRNIAVSTAGIIEGMEEFAKDFPQVNLAISLHFADDRKRDEFMPINKKHGLSDLRNFLQSYFQTNTRKVFIEYLLLGGVNDTKEDALQLAKFLKSIGKMQLIHVNLIRYNSIGENLHSSSKEVVKRFKDDLERERVHCTIRKSMGEDIQGACGQLAGKAREDK